MATIAFDTIQAADQRSREWWTAVLGRDKHAQDITEYAYSRIQRTGDAEADADLPDGVDVAIVIPERDAMLDTLIRADQLTPDELAALVDLYPPWSADSVQYDADAIVAYDSQLYRIVTPHTSQESWTPDATPALWEPCAPPGTIPIWQAPSGAHDSYAKGDRVTWPAGGSVWESTVDNNVWEPGVFGWVVVNP